MQQQQLFFILHVCVKKQYRHQQHQKNRKKKYQQKKKNLKVDYARPTLLSHSLVEGDELSQVLFHSDLETNRPFGIVFNGDKPTRGTHKARRLESSTLFCGPVAHEHPSFAGHQKEKRKNCCVRATMRACKMSD